MDSIFCPLTSETDLVTKQHALPVHILKTGKSTNIDSEVVASFGEEWEKFNRFTDEEIIKTGDEYFDIVSDDMLKGARAADFGCGTGRWARYIAAKAASVDGYDPSDAIFSAAALLNTHDNIRLIKAAIDELPVADDTYDFAMSIGVLHHIPDTARALADCVKKLRKGGYFYTYLYYRLDNRGFLYKTLFRLVNGIRKIVSALPSGLKKFSCELIAIFFYMPWILTGRLLILLGLRKAATHLPLYYYIGKSWYIIRNDALDRFGTRLEQRFCRDEVIRMMTEAGLGNIVVSDQAPYWHAVGRKE